MRSSMGFQAQQSLLHFLTLLLSPQFGPSLLHEEKSKRRPAPGDQYLETSTSTMVQKQWFSVALCTVLTLLNDDQLLLAVITACSLNLCMLAIAYCRLSTVTGFKSRVYGIHLGLQWGTCIQANVPEVIFVKVIHCISQNKFFRPGGPFSYSSAMFHCLHHQEENFWCIGLLPKSPFLLPTKTATTEMIFWEKRGNPEKNSSGAFCR